MACPHTEEALIIVLKIIETLKPDGDDALPQCIVLMSVCEHILAKDIHGIEDILTVHRSEAISTIAAKYYEKKTGLYPKHSSVELIIGEMES